MSYHIGAVVASASAMLQPRWDGGPLSSPPPPGWRYATNDVEGQRMAAMGIAYTSGAIEPVAGMTPYWPMGMPPPAGWRYIPGATTSMANGRAILPVELIPGTKTGQQSEILPGTVAVTIPNVQSPPSSGSWLLPVVGLGILLLLLK